MNDSQRAEEHLRVIRNLMERATHYRAISAPTALIGGVLALLLSGGIWWSEQSYVREHSELMRHLSARAFAALWLGALVFVLASNTFFVSREAARSGHPFFSASLKLALRTILPCLILPAAITIWFFTDGYATDNELRLVTVWIGFYGLALVATQNFAPRSLVGLGACFLGAGALMFLGTRYFELYPTPLFPNLAMGATFGLFHLIYAFCLWRSASS